MAAARARNSLLLATAITTHDQVYLLLEIRGATYTGYYSEDGTHWTTVGSHTVSAGIDMSRLGLGAGHDRTDIRIPADFDYIDVRLEP